MSRFRICLVTVVGTLALGLVVGCGQPVVPPGVVLPPPEILRVEVKEVIRISPEGDAAITRALVVPPSPLSELYLAYWKAYDEQKEVRDNFLAELQKQYLILLAQTILRPFVEPVRPPVALLAAAPFELRVTAAIPRLAKYVPEERVWHVAVGPQVREMMELAVDELLNALVFQSLYLESLPKEQRLDRRREVRFELPAGARIVNRKELSELRWFVDFGGGTYLKGSLVVEELVVTFIEELVQTERPPTNLLDKKLALVTAEALAKHGVFTIKYSLPGVIPLPVPRPIPPSPPTGFVPPTNFSGYWSYSYSGTVSATLTPPAGSTVTISATPSLYFGAHLGWEFKPWWEGGGLKKFEAWIDVNPSLSASLSADIKQRLTWNGRVIVWTRHKDFWFCVKTWPVWIRLSVEASAHASVSAGARVKFTCDASAGGTNRLGAKWETGVGWTRIVSRSPWARSPSFTVTTGASSTTTAGPGLTLAAYVYNVAGPFVGLTPYLKGELRVSPNTWELKAGFRASGGVQLAGWLRGFLGGLGSYSVDFYTWETRLATGTWR